MCQVECVLPFFHLTQCVVSQLLQLLELIFFRQRMIVRVCRFWIECSLHVCLHVKRVRRMPHPLECIVRLLLATTATLLFGRGFVFNDLEFCFFLCSLVPEGFVLVGHSFSIGHRFACGIFVRNDCFLICRTRLHLDRHR